MRQGSLNIPMGARRHVAPPPVLLPAGVGRLRKVALIGGHPDTVDLAPYHDPSWEIWAHASVRNLCQRVDRYFDLHPREVFTDKGHARYWLWLQRNTTPIYMQQRWADIPGSARYPKERVLAEFRRYITNHIGWMVALALTEGVTHLAFYGVHYDSQSEYAEQRAGCEYWMGVAEGRGVQLVLPQSCPLLAQPKELYGYESHTPELYAARKAKFKKDKEVQIAKAQGKHPQFDPVKLEPVPISEVAAHARMDLTWGDRLGPGPALGDWLAWEDEREPVGV